MVDGTAKKDLAKEFLAQQDDEARIMLEASRKKYPKVGPEREPAP